MSRHKIIFHVELTDGEGDNEKVLHDIRTAMIENATEVYGIKDYQYGVAIGEGGYDGPFLVGIQAIDPDS